MKEEEDFPPTPSTEPVPTGEDAVAFVKGIIAAAYSGNMSGYDDSDLDKVGNINKVARILSKREIPTRGGFRLENTLRGMAIDCRQNAISEAMALRLIYQWYEAKWKIIADPSLAKPKPKPGLQSTNAASIEPETIDYIWKNRLARGMHTAIAGVGGKGKSQLAYAIIAAITTGGPWPDGEGNAPKGRCIILSAEEGSRDMIIPRLIAAGADRSMVEIIDCIRNDDGTERKFNLQQDLDALKKLCLKFGDVVLISIDPVSSYMGGDVDTHRNSAVRTVLDPITKCADEIRCAILSITHFNKNTSQKAINRVMESAAFTNAPRAAFAVMEDPDDPENGRLFLMLKTNMGKPPKGLAFHIEEAPGGFDKKRRVEIKAPRVVWDGVVDTTADDVTAQEQGRPAPKREEAVSFLYAQLSGGPVLVKDVDAKAKAAGITKKTLRNAVEAIGLKSTTKGPGQPWFYSLDSEAAEAVEDFP